jgi:4-hydroxybenzoate polyprenyltransferase
VAGGSFPTALAVGLSMTFLQFAIGALNDLVDAPADAGRKPGKPIPEGVISSRLARVVVATAALGGVGLSLISGGPGLAVIALLGLAIGAWYDLQAKGTTMSWLPLAIGIPLLPVYGWYGATGTVPGVFVVLVPAAANAGTALAIANAIVDVERDTEAGRESIATALGPLRAGLVVVLLHGVVVTLALATAGLLGAPAGWMAAVAAAAGAPLTGAVVGLVGAARNSPGIREVAWEIQAIGTGLLAVAWLGALSAAGTSITG